MKPSADSVLIAAVAAIVAAVLLPLPAAVLDVGLALNLAASFALLVAALCARHPLELSAFPSLVLLTTLARLALNVCSTRLALSEGHAGQLIEAFGHLVVRGDYLVGAVAYAVLTLVQLLVVAKGSERVAEVAARFTLDAMPGKQLAIDADLRAGAIDGAAARIRRVELERESQLYGAMDGAMKFVKGDLIAGLLIFAVNLFGGTAVGALREGLSWSDAAAAYALLAIGDGLASQLPSLCVSVAAGLVVTRGGSGTSLGLELASQLKGRPRALGAAAALCAGLALVPEMPGLTFAALALMLGSAAFPGWLALLPGRSAGQRWLARFAPRLQGSTAPESNRDPWAAPQGTTAAESSPFSPLVLELSPALRPLLPDLGTVLEALHHAVHAQLGVRLPPLSLHGPVKHLPAGGYRLLIDEVPCAEGVLEPGSLYALTAPETLSFLRLPIDPALDASTEKSCARLSIEHREQLLLAEVPTRTAAEQLGAHLAVVLRQRASLLLGLAEVQALLDEQPPALVREALARVPLFTVAEVLRRLLCESVSLRNLRSILEALAGASELSPGALTERCRSALRRQLSHQHAPEGTLFAHLLDPSAEEQLLPGKALDPDWVEGLLVAARALSTGVVLTAPELRAPLRRLLEGSLPGLAVLSYAELAPELKIRPLGRLACSRYAG
jgi:type III secretion protein V